MSAITCPPPGGQPCFFCGTRERVPAQNVPQTAATATALVRRPQRGLSDMPDVILHRVIMILDPRLHSLLRVSRGLNQMMSRFVPAPSRSLNFCQLCRVDHLANGALIMMPDVIFHRLIRLDPQIHAPLRLVSPRLNRVVSGFVPAPFHADNRCNYCRVNHLANGAFPRMTPDAIGILTLFAGSNVLSQVCRAFRPARRPPGPPGHP